MGVCGGQSHLHEMPRPPGGRRGRAQGVRNPEAPAQPCQPPGPPLPSQGPLRRTTCPHHFNSCLDRHQARCLTVRSPQSSSSEPTLTGRTCPCPETAKKHPPAAPKLSPTPQLPAAASACSATQPSPLRPVTENRRCRKAFVQLPSCPAQGRVVPWEEHGPNTQLNPRVDQAWHRLPLGRPGRASGAQ